MLIPETTGLIPKTHGLIPETHGHYTCNSERHQCVAPFATIPSTYLCRRAVHHLSAQPTKQIGLATESRSTESCQMHRPRHCSCGYDARLPERSVSAECGGRFMLLGRSSRLMLCKTDSQVTGVVIQERESRFSEVKCTCRIWVHQNAPYLDCQRPPTRTAFADIWTTSAATAC